MAKLNFRMKFFPATFLLLWASGFVFLKVGLHYADPLTFLGLRYLCVVAVLLVSTLSIKPAFPKTSCGWGALLAVGLFLQAGYFACTYLSLRYGMAAGSIALITSQQPILIGLLAPTIAGERVTSTRWAGLLLGVVGANKQAISPLGILFGVLALLSMA
jgi:drug/metabolite transporter (DMT)-like permease